MRLICPKKSSYVSDTDPLFHFGITKGKDTNTYFVNNLDYKVYDTSDILIDTFNGLTKNNNNDTLSYFYNYQIIKIPYDEFSFNNNTTTTYKIIPSFSSGNILEGETNPPTLTQYLAGGCFSIPVTNSINYLSSNINNDYTVTHNFPSATASMHIGTVQPLSTGLILTFNKNEVKLMKNNNTYFAIGNVKSDGTVYSYGTITGPFGNTQLNFDSSNWHTDARIISSKPQLKTFTTTFEKYIGYKINATKENKNEVKIVGDFKFTFTENENQINETTLIQNGVDSPEVNSVKFQSSNANSTVTPTKPYAVFHAIIPYSFINLYHYFYDYNYQAKLGLETININDINNNGLILFVPVVNYFYDEATYARYLIYNRNQIKGNVIREVIINFSGQGTVIVATKSENNRVISDENQYDKSTGHNELGYNHGGTLYRNGKNTGKYATKISVDNSSIIIKMINFEVNPKKGNNYYQPRLSVIC